MNNVRPLPEFGKAPPEVCFGALGRALLKVGDISFPEGLRGVELPSTQELLVCSPAQSHEMARFLETALAQRSALKKKSHGIMCVQDVAMEPPIATSGGGTENNTPSPP